MWYAVALARLSLLLLPNCIWIWRVIIGMMHRLMWRLWNGYKKTVRFRRSDLAIHSAINGWLRMLLMLLILLLMVLPMNLGLVLMKLACCRYGCVVRTISVTATTNDSFSGPFPGHCEWSSIVRKHLFTTRIRWYYLIYSNNFLHFLYFFVVTLLHIFSLPDLHAWWAVWCTDFFFSLFFTF